MRRRTSKSRSIAVVTGTRAEYGILTPVLRAIDGHPRLRLRLLVTGMHLMREFGHTVRGIARDGWPLTRVPCKQQGDTPAAMADAAGRAMRGFTRALARLQPDWLVLLGDRGEMLAAAWSAYHLGIPVLHIHGGERSGHIDDAVRHAISRLAHLHATATPGAAQRLVRAGEQAWRVHCVGAPALDTLRTLVLPSPAAIRNAYRLGAAPYVLVVQHPVAGEVKAAARQLAATLAAVRGTGHRAVVVFPNADAGGRAMIRVLRRHAHDAQMTILRSVPQPDYFALLRGAAALVGNSSSGMIEAPALKVPVVNIGSRQRQRERGENVIDCGYGVRAVTAALRRALTDRQFRARVRSGRHPFGNGRAAQCIARLLAITPLDARLREKELTY